jgi:hypothetical protein
MPGPRLCSSSRQLSARTLAAGTNVTARHPRAAAPVRNRTPILIVEIERQIPRGLDTQDFAFGS